MAYTPSYTQITAAESTANVPSSRGVRDVGKGIAYVNSDQNPLIALTRNAKGQTRKATNRKVEWIEKEMLPPRWDQVNGAATTGETSVTVDNGGYFTAGDIVRVVPTGELLFVSSVSSNTLTVTRSFGDSDGTAAATISDNSDLLILGNAIAEGAAVGTPKSHQEVYKYNFTQIFRTEFGATGTEAVTLNYTGNDRLRMAKEAAIEHAVDIERVFLFGERNEDTGTTASPRRSAGGLEYFLTSNLKDASGTLTEPEIEDWVQDLFQQTGGSSKRLLLASPKTCSVIDQLAAGRLQTVPKEDTFGVAIKNWTTAHGDLMIVKHPLLTNGAGGTGYAGYNFAIEPSRLKYVYMDGRDTKLLKDRQAPGDDKFVDEYLTECSFEIHNDPYHGVLYGVTG